MGPDMNSSTKELLIVKDDLLDSMLQGLREWDGTIEAGIQLIEKNQERLDSIKEINRKIFSVDEDAVDMDSYSEKLKLITDQLDRFTTSMRRARKEIIEEKKLLKKKDEVVGNYIAKKNKSVFIDKDV